MAENNSSSNKATGRFSIELTGLHFYAKHGMYAEEQVLGAEFEVAIAIECAAPDNGAVNLAQTINYVKVYEIVKSAFEQPMALLENCALHISDKVQQEFLHILKIVISIKKLSPPITGFGGSVGVKYIKEL